MPDRDEKSFRRIVESVYKHGLRAAFFGEGAAETTYRKYGILTGLGSFAQNPRDVL